MFPLSNMSVWCMTCLLFPFGQVLKKERSSNEKQQLGS